MEILIHVIANAVARYYQERSPLGGIVGAVVGAIAGTLLALGYTQFVPVNFPIAATIATGIAGAFFGSILGAAIGPRPTAEDGDLAAQFPVVFVRVYRLNQGLVPIPFLLATTALAIAEPRANKSPDPQLRLIIAGVALAIFLVQGCMTLWFTFDADAVTRVRLLRRKRIPWKSISRAEFYVMGNDAGSVRAPNHLRLLFHDGRALDIPLPPHKAAPIAHLLLAAEVPFE